MAGEEPIGEARVVVRIDTDEAEKRLEDLKERRRRTEDEKDRKPDEGQERPPSGPPGGPRRPGTPGEGATGVGTAVLEAGGRGMGAIRAARTALIGGGLIELNQYIWSFVAGAAENDEGGFKGILLDMVQKEVREAVDKVSTVQAHLRAGLTVGAQTTALGRTLTLLRGDSPEGIDPTELVKNFYLSEVARQNLNQARQQLGREMFGSAVTDFVQEQIRENLDGRFRKVDNG